MQRRMTCKERMTVKKKKEWEREKRKNNILNEFLRTDLMVDASVWMRFLPTCWHADADERRGKRKKKTNSLRADVLRADVLCADVLRADVLRADADRTRMTVRTKQKIKIKERKEKTY